jgi:hypothetical protein
MDVTLQHGRSLVSDNKDKIHDCNNAPMTEWCLDSLLLAGNAGSAAID